MPEYLSPGVYIEEVPSRIKAIEGVSTSTAGFVGAARRGPVAGLALPFQPDPGWTVQPDATPILVTSYSEYVRQFGSAPLNPAERDEYLAHSVRAFFDNGGKRCFIARVVNEDPNAANDRATRGFVRVGQGPIARLTRTVRVNDSQLFLNSLRGIDVGTQLSILRAADGSNVLTSPAVITGAVAAPFGLNNGDQIGVQVGGVAGQVNMAAINAAPATLRLPIAAVANVAGLALTLRLRVGGPNESEQIITFDTSPGGDFALPGNATIPEFIAVLAANTVGLRVIDDRPVQNSITLSTDVSGTGAYLETTAALPAVFGGGAAGRVANPANQNVADLAHVTAAEIIALFPASPNFRVVSNAAGHLQVISTAAGAAATLTIVDQVPGSANRLGFPAGNLTGAGSGNATATVASYDIATGMVTLNAALSLEILPSDVYVTLNSVAWRADGPIFHARNPGQWAEDLQILIQPSDRSAVPISAAANAGQPDVQVDSTSSFYRGAIVEIDEGTRRSYYELLDILPGNTLHLGANLPRQVNNGFARVVEIDIIISEPDAAITEVYRGLSWNPGARPEIRRRHYSTIINARSRLVFVQPPNTGTPAPNPAGVENADLASMPMTGNGFAARPLVADRGSDGAPPRVDDYLGRDNGPGARSGIQALMEIDDIRLIAAPGQTDIDIQLELISQCERLRYRFALLDGESDPVGASIVNAVLGHRSIYDTSFAAYYSPWVEIGSGENRLVLPPSGYVAGICARTDNTRGVHKAPANEVVRNVNALHAYYTTGEQDLLNPRGVNLIRRFEGRGIRVWGARTLSSDADYRYVNVRRTMIFISASIDRGTQWVVFEPNSPPTWARVVDSVSAFLNTQWRNGALFGRKPEDSYYVRCDESTMSEDDVLNGRLICEIGVAIVRPAEFVIFRIEQITGFAKS